MLGLSFLELHHPNVRLNMFVNKPQTSLLIVVKLQCLVNSYSRIGCSLLSKDNKTSKHTLSGN